MHPQKSIGATFLDHIITTNLYQLCKEKKVDRYYNKYSIGIGSRIYDFNDSE